MRGMLSGRPARFEVMVGAGPVPLPSRDRGGELEMRPAFGEVSVNGRLALGPTPQFRFVIKASRRISHIKRLKDCAEPAKFLFDAVAQLGDRLGAVLVQLPPHFRADEGRLRDFLRLVPPRIPIAFEFRHESWHEDGVLSAMSEHDAAWVWADDDGRVPEALPQTASWTYLRLRAQKYTPAKLRAWQDLLRPFAHAFAFFKHEEGGLGPKLARRLHDLAREPNG